MRGTDCRLRTASMETSGIGNIDMENANMTTPPAISPCYQDYDSKQTYVSSYFSSNNSWNIYSWNKQRSVLKANSQMRIELTISGMATWMKWNKYRSVLKSNYSEKVTWVEPMTFQMPVECSTTELWGTRGEHYWHYWACTPPGHVSHLYPVTWPCTQRVPHSSVVELLTGAWKVMSPFTMFTPKKTSLYSKNQHFFKLT